MIQLSREYTKSLAELVSRYRYDIFFDNLDEQLNLPKYRENGNVKRIGKSWLKKKQQEPRGFKIIKSDAFYHIILSS